MKWNVFQAGKQGQTGAGWNLQHSKMESYLMGTTRKRLLNLDMMKTMTFCFPGIAGKTKMIHGKRS